MIGFTKRKFSSFPPAQQHKKCSELLRTIYCDLLQQKAVDENVQHYNQLQTWMGTSPGTSPLSSPQTTQIANRFHWHLHHADVQLHEEDFLPAVRRGDRDHPLPRWPIAIYLDHLRSAHNVGSILRTIEAFSLGTPIFSDQTPDLNHPQVKKTSMGASEWVPESDASDLTSLPKPIIALETSPDAIPLHTFSFPDTFTLVLGNEEYGCSEETLRAADVLIEIPLRGRKNSLNVANAFAIAAAEIARQREET